MFWCVWRERRTRWLRCLHLQSKSKEIRSTTAARTLLVTSQPAISSSGKQQTGSSTFGGCCSISHSFISNAFCHNSTHYSSQSQSTVQNMEGELGFLSLFWPWSSMPVMENSNLLFCFCHLEIVFSENSRF